jgi:hypothetical protein
VHDRQHAEPFEMKAERAAIAFHGVTMDAKAGDGTFGSTLDMKRAEAQWKKAPLEEQVWCRIAAAAALRAYGVEG